MSKAIVKLLIVEDEDNIRNGIETYIRLNSQCIDKIYTASNGSEALEIIYEYKPDLMLMDVQIPHKDGLTVMKEAKAAGVCPKTIILSGYDQFEYAQKAIRYGAMDYFLKPSRPMDILSKLENLIQDKDTDNNDEEGTTNVGKQNKEKQANRFVTMAVEYINENYMSDLTLKVVADKVGVTSAYLSTLFTQTLDCGFIDYLNQIRIDRACNFLHDNQLKSYEVAYKVGFHDEKYFTKVFKKILGLSPSQYRKTL